MKVQSTNAQSLADHLFPKSFSEALRYLRKRAHLTQDELGRSVGYSREQIARLENGSRLPDLAVVAALFVPALDIQHQPKLIQQLLELAGQMRNASSGILTDYCHTHHPDKNSQGVGNRRSRILISLHTSIAALPFDRAQC